MKKKTIRLISLMLAVIMAATAIVYVSADEQEGFFAELFGSKETEETVLSGAAAEAETEEPSSGEEENNEKTDSELTYEADEEPSEEIAVSDSALNITTTTAAADNAEVVITGSCGDDAVYTLYDSGQLIISGTGDMDDYTYNTEENPWCSEVDNITSAVIQSGITSIGDCAFCDCRNLTEVTIPDSVTSIGAHAFRYCESLPEITIPGGVTSIGSYAFCGCSNLPEIILPEGITSIGSSTFSHCTGLPEITIPDGVISIGSYAFNGCYNLTKITLPVNLTSIGSYAFDYCESLPEITIPDGVTKIDSYTFRGCSSLTNIVLPENLTSIGSSVFYGCSSLPEIIIPDSVTTIGNTAFSGCSGLTSITLPENLTSIGSAAFYGCSSLPEITIPDSVTTIGSTAFSGCSGLTNIVLPEGLTSIEYYVFSNCSSLPEITIPGNVTSISVPVFDGCSSLKSVNVDESSTSYASVDGVLFNKDLTSLIFYPTGKAGTDSSYSVPDSVTSIGSYAFYKCADLESITLSAGLISIESYAFRYCDGLKSVVLPNTAESIGAYAFADCDYLMNIEIPASVTSISSNSFSNCSKSVLMFFVEEDSYALSYAEKYSYNYTIGSYDAESLVEVCSGSCGSDAEYVLYNNGELVISGTGAMTDYYTSTSSIPWYSYRSYVLKVTIEDGITSIGASAFQYCQSMTEAALPDSLTSIGYSAFSNCKALKSIAIPDSVTSMGSGAFSSCSSLSEITLSENLTAVDSYIFSHCSSLAEITIPDSVTSIGSYAFSSCSSLSEITIPVYVTSISESAFGDSGLTTVYCYENSAADDISLYPDGTNLIYVGKAGDMVYASGSCGDNAEYTLYYNGSLIISGTGAMTDYSSSSKLPYYSYISYIKTVTVENGITNIGKCAFYGCTALAEIEIPASVTGIGDRAFYNCKSLKKIEIPASVTSIGSYAFYSCTALAEAEIPDSVTSIGEYAFYGCTALTEIEIPDSVTKIQTYTFYGCTSLKNVDLPDSITNIYSFAFEKCSSLTSIVIPDSVSGLGQNVFSYCTSLTSAILPDSFTDLGYGAFSGCTSLTSVNIPKSAKQIDSSAFSGCTSLASIDIPESVTRIYTSAFSGCTSLTSIDIPESVTSISNYAFDGCTSLKSINIPEAVTSIEAGTFRNCTSLVSIIIPDSVTSISNSAFSGCSGMEKIYIPEGAVLSSSSAIEGFSEDVTVYCYSNTSAYTYAEELGYNIFVLDEHVHEYEVSEVTGSCTNQGYTQYTCSVCGYIYKDNYYGGEGHQFGDWITQQEATIFCEGYSYRVCSVCGETETETTSKISVDTDSNSNYGLANFTIVNASTLEPIGGAAVYIYTESDGEGTVYADSSGKLSAVLPIGKQQIQVYASGYESRNLTVTIVSGEQNIAAIGLSTGSLVDAELTASLMTEEEIEEAGIDVEAEDNNQVYKYEITFVFEPENTISYTAYFGSGSGKSYSKPKQYKIKKPGTGSSSTGVGGSGGYTTVTIYPVSEKYYLVVVGEVKWLKEMFDVQLVVINNSSTDTIENCTAELVLPEGLSLASMTSGVQSASQNIDYVEENGTETVHWYVRGDAEGEYTLTAKLDGELMPFEEEFSYEYTTTEPLKVYAGSALHMTIKAPGTTYYGDDYPITIELENVSDRTIYNLSHTILSLEQFKATTYSDGSVVEESYIDTEQDQVSVTRYNADGTVSEEITTTVDDYVIGEATADEFKPGDKLVIELTSNIMFESDVINGKAAQILAAVEEAQKVLDAYNCSTAGSEILKDAYSVIEETASSINFVVNDDDVAEDSKKEAYSELAVAVGQLLRIIKTGSSSSLEVIKRLEKTGVYDDFYEISQDASYYSTHTEEGINSILKVANTIINGCSEAEFETYSVFNILKSIAESMPVSFILEDVFVTTLEGSTTEIPYTVEITEGDSPVSYNVEAVGSYLYSLLCSAMGSDVPRFADVFSGSTEYSDYEDVIQHVKAVQNGTTTIAVEAASGDISFRAWVESALTTADLDDSVSVSSDFTLSSDNETAYIDEDGVLNFTGAGFINVTSSVETSGILYVEMTNGDETDVTAYVIDVVEEHTCSSDEWVTVVEPTETSEGYMVKVCDVCGDVIDIKTTTLCESHSFGSYVVEVEPTEDEYGLKVKTCETCGYKQYSVIGISDTLELTEDSAYTIDESSGYVSGISDKTSIADFVENFENDSEDIVVLNTNGTEVDITSTAYIGTGYIIQNIYNGEVSDQLTVVIAGDINGDGEKDVLDLAKMFDHIQEVSALEGAYLQAAYINSDDEIDVLDLAELFDKIQS